MVWHHHVQPGIGAVEVVARVPVQHDEAVETQLRLEDAVEQLVVGAGVGVVDAVVRAHDGGDAGAHAVHEGPQVQLAQRAVIDVGGLGLNAVVVAAVGLLLIPDEMLDTGGSV